MSEEETSDQGAEDKAGDGPEVISLDDIDSILAEEAPEFTDEMQDIAKSGDDFEEGDLEGTDVQVATDVKKTSKFKLLLDKVKSNSVIRVLIAAFAKVKSGYTKALSVAKKGLLGAKAKTLAFVKTAPRTTVEYLKYLAAGFSQRKKALSIEYKSKTKKEKLLIASFFLGTIVTSVVISVTIERDWVDFSKPPVLNSLESVATHRWQYDIENATTPFLTAFPQPKHSYLFRKIVVNLKKRFETINEAMGAFEFYVEVDSKDAAAELKGRETQFRDMIQRTAEQYSYESLQSEGGKTRLKEEIRSELNNELAQGWVKSVYIKFMFTKP